MELKDNESFERARENVIKELDDEQKEKINEINRLKVEIDELYIKSFIEYGSQINFEGQKNKKNEYIEKLRAEVKQLDAKIRGAKKPSHEYIK